MSAVFCGGIVPRPPSKQRKVAPRTSNRGVFDSGSNSQDRYVPNHDRLRELVRAAKTIGLKVVLTMGTFDVIHIGHFLYLEKARLQGDLLVVGVDSDEKVKKRKGPDRPIVSEDERIEMLTHVRHVDVVTIKNESDPKWHLIKLIEPDVLIATKTTYTQAQLRELRHYCGEVMVLEPQATTSTSAKLRLMQIGFADKLAQKLPAKIKDAIDELLAEN
jgi:D-glycero-beta-D-manno-heptose 1-phosphate adenylyltransferase